MSRPVTPKTAVVTGGTGQMVFLVRRLLDEGWTVWATVRDTDRAEEVFGAQPGLKLVHRDLLDPGPALCAHRGRQT